LMRAMSGRILINAMIPIPTSVHEGTVPSIEVSIGNPA
jgi:hypothetical protein